MKTYNNIFKSLTPTEIIAFSCPPFTEIFITSIKPKILSSIIIIPFQTLNISGTPSSASPLIRTIFAQPINIQASFLFGQLTLSLYSIHFRPTKLASDLIHGIKTRFFYTSSGTQMVLSINMISQMASNSATKSFYRYWASVPAFTIIKPIKLSPFPKTNLPLSQYPYPTTLPFK